MTPSSRPLGVLAVLRSPRLLLREALAGLVVALALIPEAISFSVIAGVDPRVGLFSSVVMAIAIAIVGGRPAMISAATAAVALVVAPIAPQYGIDYLIATILLGGLIQIVLGLLGVAKLLRFIPRSVMTGFVNALAIFVFTAQLPHLIDVPWVVYPLVAGGLLVVLLLPKLTKAVPGPLVAIVLVTVVAVVANLDVPTVGDQGALPDVLPVLGLPQVPLTLETLQIIGPYALGMAVVGLLESLMTAKLVDEITETGSSKTRESWGQGVANIASGLFGGMGGCAVVGQTMINVKTSGARSRVSTFLAGAFLLALLLALGPIVGLIPMAALVAVMIVVAAAAFDWHSIRSSTLRRMPLGETAVMVLTVAGTVITHNLAIGVGLGVLAAMVVFARRVAHFATVTLVARDDDEARYRVEGELFFASSNDLVQQFDYAADPASIVIDLSGSHVWDASTVAALDAVAERYRRHGATVRLEGMNEASSRFHGRLAGTLGSAE
ncbi:SulP family inorganic anion transporter [Arenivirga flava]|uniref:Sodium-independent anion transporter n=1 Tax=Arenivirga flava TaxID=1930060 RepID=A0AA37XCF4_9MICO|nr:SulP family inorganic anion transporter [Arenivirga flava]GMA29850.1 sodium-independent anion transporter [Arenivirga flava]